MRFDVLTNCVQEFEKKQNSSTGCKQTYTYFTFMWLCIVTNFFIIKPNRCTNFQNVLRHETVHVSGSYSAYHQEFIPCTLGTGICHTGVKTASEEYHPGLARKLSSNLYDIYHCWVYSNDGQRNCPKYVEFHAGVNLGNWYIWLAVLQRSLHAFSRM